MADGNGFTVKPGELTAAGNNALTVAGKVPDETAKLAEPSDKAAGSLAGWQSGVALQGCSTAWKTLLDGLSGDMKTAGGNLITCAQTYVNADHLPGAPTATGVSDPFRTKVIGVHPTKDA
ncbi:hypothetical protein BX285_0488 [Streptomyces sp. 1114.5]|uniref:hypothetical protein n=1 Tax=unclassified Streptomyces TaxID=2593676 RepID=UPI000BD4E7E5|nr:MULTISPECIES: hypothetical protein [unclassified Streptomyces]RKT16162.1 hypothetical protein BX285_0488 [Streptomyces sp. 1114.5]SOB82333.1 hypothetical protein SAMN06272789_2492 [Streptomyces sp. 1331.2]